MIFTTNISWNISLIEQMKEEQDERIHTRVSGELSDDKAGGGNFKLIEELFIE